MALIALTLSATDSRCEDSPVRLPQQNVISTISRTGDRLREGTELVNVEGTFKLTGDRATFYPTNGLGRFSGLENQTLERVATVIAEDPSPMVWLVTGTITEYKGNNYILVTRAILRAKPVAATRPTARVSPRGG